jgi:O-antigen/teichoic acid export membrane protein
MKLDHIKSEAAPSIFRRAILRIGGGKAPLAILDQALVSGANFVTNILLARTLGFRDYGVFALAWVAVLFANSLQWAFVVTPMMSIGPKQETDEIPSYYGAVLFQEIVFALSAALLVFTAVILSARYFPQWNVGSIGLPLSAATLSYLLQDFIRRYFFSTNRIRLAFTTDCISYLTQLPILFYISRHPNVTLSTVLWIIAATSFIGFIACVSWYQPVAFNTQTLRKVFLRHWKLSRWLAPSAFMQWGAGNLFLMAAPVYYGAAASAALKAAQNIVAVAHIWFLGLDNVVIAEASMQMHKKGPDGVIQYIKQIIFRWGGLTLAFTSIVALFPTFWLKLAYGTKYASYGHVLQLYALLYLIGFVAGPLRSGLQALEYTAPIFCAYPVLIALSITLAGPLARTLGLTGVMLGMIAIQIVFQGIIGIAFLLRAKRMRREYFAQQVVALHDT